MLDLKFLKNANVYVIGLGKSGLSVVNALLRSGTSVYAWDDNHEKSDISNNIKKLIIAPNEINYEELDYIIPSPGIPTEFPEPHPAIQKAKEYNVKIISDIDLLYNAQYKSDYIGITGTNGKSTTTALTAWTLDYFTKKAFIGGNFGIPVTELEHQENYGASYINVLELSSFQLDITNDLRCKIAVLLNITKDHIDRHGSIENYIEAKKRIFNNQTSEDYAIINIDDPICYEIYKSFEYPSHLIPISVKYPLNYGVWVNYHGEHSININIAGTRVIISLKEYQNLPGIYNLYNILTTLAITTIYGFNPALADRESVRYFKSLPHRMEFVREINNIKFYNDSKSTNAEASFAALSSFHNIYWILGGIAKEGGIESLVPYFKNINKAYLIGQSANEFSNFLHQYNVKHEITNELKTAITSAFNDASSSSDPAYIIMSPVCASYDQFNNFEDRGDKFKESIKKL